MWCRAVSGGEEDAPSHLPANVALAENVQYTVHPVHKKEQMPSEEVRHDVMFKLH